ncbi:MAG TPA: AGE family epimerase/isomerase [Burkholderiaceae bacterium]|nr:AGE family epimerase/isomerase [Burkholderiaceae bacterium]
MTADLPDFRAPEFLRAHVLQTMSFYDGRCIDPTGGFFHAYLDDGTVYDRRTRHLVSSTRFVIVHAWAARHFPEHERSREWRDAARHGMAFLREAHHDLATGGYAWVLNWDAGRKTVVDSTNRCYGLAFVLLAHAEALRAGIEEARQGIADAFELMERRFWLQGQGLYADEAGADWKLTSHRGQNANMHACEAMLSAYEATGETRYRDRAAVLANSVTVRLAAHRRGLISEHYREDWTPDWDYARESDNADIFRPWGYQTGHHTEWAKLLTALERSLPEHPQNEDLVHRARELFAAGVNHGWDRHHEGLAYAFAPDPNPAHEGRFVVSDGRKFHWVHAETFAAAAVLAERTIEGGYWDWYDRVWEFAWEHFVDHRHGAWFCMLSANNKKISDKKSPPCKTDYHTMGACYEVLAALERA